MNKKVLTSMMLSLSVVVAHAQSPVVSEGLHYNCELDEKSSVHCTEDVAGDKSDYVDGFKGRSAARKLIDKAVPVVQDAKSAVALRTKLFYLKQLRAHLAVAEWYRTQTENSYVGNGAGIIAVAGSYTLMGALIARGIVKVTLDKSQNPVVQVLGVAAAFGAAFAGFYEGVSMAQPMFYTDYPSFIEIQKKVSEEILLLESELK